MLLPKQRRSADREKLLECYNSLPREEKVTLLKFAQFLARQQGEDADLPEREEPVNLEPRPIPKPDNETVVGAIKRLSASYHMLEKSELLTETSSLMTAHIMHGRDADEVIEELEALFIRYHAAFVEKHRADPDE
ncbi:MAG: hypothetical protein OQL28_03360 [Sedimenticola sp.]|nr:hypothetical protein [Sedimenticola sp.]